MMPNALTQQTEPCCKVILNKYKKASCVLENVHKPWHAD